MWVRRLITIIVAGTVLTACETPFNAEDPAVVAAIDSILESAMAGARAVDADRVLAMAEGEGELTLITGDVLLSGLETIRSQFKDTYAGLESQDQVVFEKRVRLLSPDVALVMAVSEGTYTDQAGWTSEPVGLGLTIVFVREKGAWRARHAHQSIAF